MNLKLIIKAFAVGIGKIIPGISGSMLAIVLGIYEMVVDAITNFFQDIKTNLKILINFGIGFMIAILFFSKLLLFLLSNYYFEVVYLFLGLMIGTLFCFSKNVKINKKNISLFLIFLILSLSLTFISGSTYVFKESFLDYLYTSFLGFIDAFTSIIPGISGTAVYMVIGSYEYVLNILSHPLSLNFLIYLFGLVMGVLIILKLVSYLFKNKREEMNAVILAFMISSLIVLFLNIIDAFSFGLFSLLLLGIVIGYMGLRK